VDNRFIWGYNQIRLFEWDETKRAKNLANQGLDFALIEAFNWELAIIEKDERRESARQAGHQAADRSRYPRLLQGDGPRLAIAHERCPPARAAGSDCVTEKSESRPVPKSQKPRQTLTAALPFPSATKRPLTTLLRSSPQHILPPGDHYAPELAGSKKRKAGQFSLQFDSTTIERMDGDL
jgi:hypothetical protein